MRKEEEESYFTPTMAKSGDGGSWADPAEESESSCIPPTAAKKEEGKLIMNMGRIKAAVNGSIPLSSVISTKTGPSQRKPGGARY